MKTSSAIIVAASGSRYFCWYLWALHTRAVCDCVMAVTPGGWLELEIENDDGSAKI